MPKARGVKVVSNNRSAFHDYFILERFEAGISLSGTEVKSIRAGHINLKDSYCAISSGEIYAKGIHIRKAISTTAIRSGPENCSCTRKRS